MTTTMLIDEVSIANHLLRATEASGFDNRIKVMISSERPQNRFAVHCDLKLLFTATITFNQDGTQTMNLNPVGATKNEMIEVIGHLSKIFADPIIIT